MDDGRRIEIDPQDIDAIMDRLAAKRAAKVEEEQNSDGEGTT